VVFFFYVYVLVDLRAMIKFDTSNSLGKCDRNWNIFPVGDLEVSILEYQRSAVHMCGRTLLCLNWISKGTVHWTIVLVILKLSFRIVKRCSTVCCLGFLFMESLWCFKTESNGIMYMLVTNKTFRQYIKSVQEYWIETFRATTIATSVLSIELIQKSVCISSLWN
jgi:hypothetical protein